MCSLGELIDCVDRVCRQGVSLLHSPASAREVKLLVGGCCDIVCCWYVLILLIRCVDIVHKG